MPPVDSLCWVYDICAVPPFVVSLIPILFPKRLGFRFIIITPYAVQVLWQRDNHKSPWQSGFKPEAARSGGWFSIKPTVSLCIRNAVTSAVICFIMMFSLRRRAETDVRGNLHICRCRWRCFIYRLATTLTLKQPLTQLGFFCPHQESTAFQKAFDFSQYIDMMNYWSIWPDVGSSILKRGNTMFPLPVMLCNGTQSFFLRVMRCFCDSSSITPQMIYILSN